MARYKKDIDRELMYKKILPTSMAAGSVSGKDDMEIKEAAPYSPGVSKTLEISIQKPVEVTLSPVPGGRVLPQPEESPAAQNQQAPDGRTDAQVVEVTPVETPLVNLMEEFVERRLDSALKKFKCCTCEKCRKDVLTIALNKLPPLYIVEDDADTRELHERERASQVATALVQAILAIKSRPPHESNH